MGEWAVTICAVCLSTTGPYALQPLGRNDALVQVCYACRTETPDGNRGVQRGYDPGGGLPSLSATTRGMKHVLGEDKALRPTDFAKPLTPGWILVKVAVSRPGGMPRDRNEAYQRAHNRYGKGLRYLGAADGFFLWERADPKAIEPETLDVIAELERIGERE